MPTMPALSPTGQPDELSAWFRSGPGCAVLESELGLVAAALAERAGQPWLWLSPSLPGTVPARGRGLALAGTARGWSGAVSCGLPLPLPSEAFGTVVLQHVATSAAQAAALLEETARILVPGGRVWLFALNPLAPYRWRWRGLGVRVSEPLTWRRRLRAAGLHPDPVSRGIGPGWKMVVSAQPQDGPGLRAAYAIRAEKRSLPLTPVRGRGALRLPQGMPAG